MNTTKIALLIGGLLLILIILLSWGHFSESKLSTAPVSATTVTTLPGLQESPAPWQPEFVHLKDRLAAINLPALSQEGTALHIHQHLDISINGNAVAVPAEIGIDPNGKFISPIHVHDTSGIIHVESPTIQDFTLGQFFDIWGLRFTANCIGSYCTDASSTLKVYANGSPVTGDPRNLVLASHQEIMIVFGNASSTPAIISAYTFPAGY
jgi:hypothetical protein